MKRSRGRPKKKNSEILSSRVDIRLLPEEKTVMEEAAKAAGLRLSAWIRDRLLKAAANELD